MSEIVKSNSPRFAEVMSEQIDKAKLAQALGDGWRLSIEPGVFQTYCEALLSAGRFGEEHKTALRREYWSGVRTGIQWTIFACLWAAFLLRVI